MANYYTDHLGHLQKKIPNINVPVRGRDLPPQIGHHLGWLAIELAPHVWESAPEGRYSFNIVFDVDFRLAKEPDKSQMAGGLAVISTRRLPEHDDEVEVKLTRSQLEALAPVIAHAADKTEDRYIHTAEPECHAIKRQFDNLRDAAIRLDDARNRLNEEKGE